jgi:hypothetical protein
VIHCVGTENQMTASVLPYGQQLTSCVIGQGLRKNKTGNW